MTTTFTLPMDIPNFDAAMRDAMSGGAEARFVAAIALGRIRGNGQAEAISALSRLLEDPVEEVRAQALEGIAEQARGGAKIPNRLVHEALTDPSPRVRTAAIEIAAFTTKHGLLDTLSPSLSDLDPSVRATACRVVGEVGGIELADAIVRLLEDPVSFVTHEAALALAELGDLRGKSILIDLLSSRNQISIEAACALGRLREKSACSHLFRIANKRFVGTELKAMTAAALASCGQAKGRELLERMLRSKRRHTKLVALGTLARLPVADMVEQVAELLNSSRPDVISATIETLYFLAELDKEKVVSILKTKRSFLKDELLAELSDTLEALQAMR